MTMTMGWKDIDSAPLDLTEILVYTEPRAYYLVFWNGENWLTTNDDVLYEEDIIGWMPLPEMPKKNHRCESKSKDWICKTDLSTENSLILVDYRGVWEEGLACPFCGENE